MARGLARLLVIACMACAAIGGAMAAQETYDYDALGRLVRVIDEQGRVTQYVYDAAGNILQVITGGTAQAPSVATVSPASVARGSTALVSLAGTGLLNSEVTTSATGLTISAVQSTDTQVTFTLAVALTASLGPQSILLRNAAGSTTASITIVPAVPKLSMAPLPIAVPPGATRTFSVTLSNPDIVDHVISLASANTAVVTVGAASVTIPAGQVETSVTVTGVGTGTTSISLSSSGLASTAVPVFVTTNLTGLTTTYGISVGVVLQAPAGVAAGTSVSPLVSRTVVATKGAYIDGIAPPSLAIGTGPTTVVVSGVELSGVNGASVSPPDGITLGAVTPAPGGFAVSIPITVAPNAATGSRRLVLAGAQQPYFPARPDADRFAVTLPPPQIFSINPLFATPGTVAATLSIRGANLQGIKSVKLSPGTGITVDATPSASADGTTASVRLSVSPLASPATHAVQVFTPGGASPADPSPANTFAVVNEIQSTFTPIAAAPVGVVLQSNAPPPTVSSSTFSAPVVVGVGPVATGVSPSVGVIGQTLQVAINGSGLQGVTSVQIVPPNGVTVSAPAPSADGSSVSVTVTVDPAAPQTLRTVKVKAGTADVLFTSQLGSQFRVSAPLAVLQSMTPNFLQTGAAATTLTLRGLNFQNASSVNVAPPDGVVINTPSVNATGTQITVSMNALAGAITGPRAVTVTTPAGTSSAVLAAENTLTLTTTPGPTITPVAAPALGVVLQSATPPPPVSVGPFITQPLGIVLQDTTPPAPVTTCADSQTFNVALGAAATSVSAPPLFLGASGTLTISGVALNDVTAVSVVPPDNVTLGAITVAPDGRQVSVPITVLAGAAAGARSVQLVRGTTPVAFTQPLRDTFSIGVAVPTFDSISPILASRGTTFTMTIRGHNFQGASAVTATPSTGMFIDNVLSVDPSGLIMTVRISIAADAPLESKVIQIITPAGASSSDPVPANTFTVEP